MNKEERIKKLQNYIDKMPSLPTTMTKVIEVCDKPETSPADLNKVISMDPVLMGRVLRLINSAYYGLNQQITSLARAIIMLGINTIRNLALSTAIINTVKNSSAKSPINMDNIWQHSLSVAVSAKLLAKKNSVQLKELENYFVAGLLHDLGKIPLVNCFSEEYMQIIKMADQEKKSILECEQAVLEIDHTESGFLIAKAWKLSDDLKAVVQQHHQSAEVSGGHSRIVKTIAMANYFVNLFFPVKDGDCHPLSENPDNLGAANMTVEWFQKIKPEVEANITRARVFLQV